MDVRLAVKVSRLFSRPIFLESQSTRLVEQTPDERGALMVSTQHYKRKLLDNMAQFDVGDLIHRNLYRSPAMNVNVTRWYFRWSTFEKNLLKL